MAPAKKAPRPSTEGDTAHWETAREKERAMKAPRTSGIYVQPSRKKAPAKSRGKKRSTKR